MLDDASLLSDVGPEGPEPFRGPALRRCAYSTLLLAPVAPQAKSTSSGWPLIRVHQLGGIDEITVAAPDVCRFTAYRVRIPQLSPQYPWKHVHVPVA